MMVGMGLPEENARTAAAEQAAAMATTEISAVKLEVTGCVAPPPPSTASGSATTVAATTAIVAVATASFY